MEELSAVLEMMLRVKKNYLGVLEADDIMHDEVKRSMKKEYIRRVKKTLSSKLNAGNIIKAINSWAVSLLRYSGGIVNWTKSELAELDRRTRKLLTIQCSSSQFQHKPPVLTKKRRRAWTN